jgi:hypothetical protein
MEENLSLSPEEVAEVEIEDTASEETADIVEETVVAPAKPSKLGLVGLIISAVCGGLFVISLIPALFITLLLGAIVPAFLYVVGAIICGVSLILCIVAMKKCKADKKAKIGLIISIITAVLNLFAALIFGIWFAIGLIYTIVMLLSTI